MAKKYSTKKALLTSVLSMVLCFTMLLGTTFAWFTDSVTSNNNIITAGNLDVELYYQAEGKDWTKVDEDTNIFTNSLWEPGHTEVVKLKVVNEGSLALKYQLGVNVASEIGSKNVAGKTFKLSDYIMYGIVEGEHDYNNRDEAIALVTSPVALNSAYTSGSVTLEAKNNTDSDEKIVTMVVYMPTTVGNEANAAKGEVAPTINLGINLFATQATVESDSFGEDYDADTAAFTVADAQAMLDANKDATLANCVDPTGVLYIPEGYKGTLTLAEVVIAGVKTTPATTRATTETTTNIVILGNVVVNAISGTAIEGEVLNITGNGTLTAVGVGNAAFGIGGLNAKSITIEGITIEYAAGGHAYGVGNDTKYYKDAPEGGAAIGSGFDGAVITLNNVNVIKAIGGSKAAGIGARYHIGVEVNIFDSTISYVEGGVSAAGIGSSRVSNGASESATTINITNSNVTAVGGVYGAGIGSGYDTHCQAKQPMCNINIDDSIINAQGGKYAAGVGTGYHNAALNGTITNSTVNAVSGEKVYKATYTPAMDLGFGVVDPAREGQQTDSKLVVDGVEIKSSKIVSYDKSVGMQNALDSLNPGDILVLPAEIIITTGTFVVPQGVTIMGDSNGGTVIRQNSAGQDNIFNCEGDVTIKNITFETNRKGYAIIDNTKNHNTDGDITVINCSFKGLAADKNWGIYKNLNGNLTIKDCTFENYDNAVCGVSNGNNSVTMITGCTFTNINGEAIGYVSSTMPTDFEENVIANNTGLTAENVIGY